MIPEPVRFLFSPSPSYMVFWVTQNCNARCAFCFNWEENLRKNRDLRLDEIEQLARKWGHLKYLTIAGGEPTLREDLPEIVRPFVEHAGLQICSIVTNGIKHASLLEQADRICSRHPDLLLNIGVSIDYLGEEHNRHRKASGCWEGCLEIIGGVKRLRSRHPRLTVNAVGTYTADSSDSILETARAIMTTYKIPYIMNVIRGDVEDMTQRQIDPDHYHQTAREILRVQQSVLPDAGLDSALRFALEELGVDQIHREMVTGEIQSTCQAGREVVVLESNGRLRLCEILPDHFGNVRDHDYDVPGMLSSTESRQIIARMLRDNCHCTWECVNRANLAFDVKSWPRLAATGFRNMINASRSPIDE